MPKKSNPLATAHTLKDDIYGLALGVMFIAVGLNMLKFSGMVTGGIAGIALLISYYVPLSIGLLFTLVNIPFLVFCYFSMGRAFTVKTLIVSVTLGLATQAVPMLITISYLHPLLRRWWVAHLSAWGSFPLHVIMRLLAARVW